MRILFIFAIVMLQLAVFSQDDLKSDTTMKKPFLGLRTCIYLVPALNEAKAWYTKAFGVKPYFDEPFYVGFNIGGYELGLLPKDDKPDTQAENVLTYWGVEKLREVYDHLIEMGATIHEEPHNVGGPIDVATVRDPWGNVIGIIYNPEFKTEPKQ